ncbi:unnamed protein product [Rhizoctonia solani]|uniref:F-box domain-containing protein n=1 Tax=Rhizoctonia solani TaxID=456999 RepID=A0A8H3BPX6_9AGAM|nr:unnamed protein product [Rhizoctonia solani]
MEELTKACKLLDSALERYYNACVALELEVYHDFAQVDLHGTFLENLADKLSKSMSHQKRLKQSEMALCRVRNHSPSFVPISALPPEVLIRIFNMLHSCCFESRKKLQLAVPVYPDTLAWVCSRWRRIAISSRVLWSHIDLSPCKGHNQRLLSRGNTFASRSAQLPLDLHIGGSDGPCSSENLARFCAEIGMRVRSLKVFSPDADRFKEIYTPVFNACFMHCGPGILEHLAVWGESSRYSFIWSARENNYLQEFTTNTQTKAIRSHIDELLIGVRVLDLGVNCIPPESRAYCGLVELHLMGSDRDMRFTEAQFLRILAASPKLRILHLDVSIRDASTSPPRVQLNELDVLFLSWAEDKTNLIRLLYPGAPSLKLILDARNRLSMSRSAATEFIKLFERSNVTELYVHHIMGTPGCGEALFNPFHLLELAPHLQTLAISGIDINRSFRRLTNHPGSILNTARLLHTLHLAEASIDWISCLELVRTYGVQEITIWDCTLYKIEGDSRIQQDQEVIRSIFADMCPETRILKDSILKLAGVHEEK